MRLVAVIGSFRHHNYGGVVGVIDMFRPHCRVTSPAGSEIMSGTSFVRFATDAEDLSDETVQSLTLENIFSADAVYVVAPEGYVGNTTCYEIGRVIQRRQPIYFSNPPLDLPVHIPDSVVARPESFVLRFLTGNEPFHWLFDTEEGALFDVERRLA